MVRLIAATAVASVLVASSARAQIVPEPGPRPRKNAIYGIVGLGTPVGFAGFEMVRHLGAPLELSAGVGAGLTAMLAGASSPLQWSVMPRLRVGQDDRNVLTLGAGVSGGAVGNIPLFCDEYCDPPRASYPTDYYLWGNLEVGGEHQMRSGFAVRYFTGYARGCDTATCTSVLAFPYFGIGIGAAF